MAQNRSIEASVKLDQNSIEELTNADDLEGALELLGAIQQFQEDARILQSRLDQVKLQQLNNILSRDDYSDERSKLGLDIRKVLRGEPILPLTPDPPDWPHLRDLAEKIEKNWVKAFYERYLPDSRPIPIPVRADFAAVDHPWPGSVALPQIPESSSIVQVYEQMNGYLLVLGAAGSGKTFGVLQITAHLLHKLKADHTLPAPAILDLSDWNRNFPSLADWAVERLNKTYVVDKKAARDWLENDRIVLFLDHLDQVSDANRGACVESINQFLSDYAPKGLVVCSREAEYEKLTPKLRLWAAVQLQPLDRQEIVAYLTSGSPKLAELNGIISADAGLLELCATPLGLSLLWETYRAGGLDASMATTGTLAEKRSQMFDRYIERVLPKAPAGGRRYTRDRSLRWLGCLARFSNGVFWFERMQPAWLPNRAWQHIYYFISRMLFGLVAGLLGGVIIGMGLGPTTENLWRGVIEGLTAGLVVGVVGWLTDALWQNRFQQLSNPWLRSALNIAVLVIGSALGVVALFLLVLRHLDVLYTLVPKFESWELSKWFEEASSVGVLTGLSVGAVFGIESNDGPRNLANDIQTGSVERLQLSVLRAWRFGPFGLAFGVVAGLVIAIMDLRDWSKRGEIFISPLTEWAYGHGWTGGASVAAVTVLAAVICGLAAASIGSLTGSAIVPQSRDKPDQAIRLSLHNALIIGGVMSALWFALGYALGGFRFALYGLFIGYLAFLWFGGLNVYLHFVLRLILHRLDYTPRIGRYTPFLNHCTELRIMSAIMGGYVFRHSLWQEHFIARLDM